MKRQRPEKMGFSLIEIVIVLFLTGIILFCVSGLTDQTFKTLRFLQEKSKSSESATLACGRLASEMREMIDVPGFNGTRDSISFRKVRPSADLGVGNVSGDPPTSWSTAYSSGQTATIVYRLDENKVMRRVNSEKELEVATNVQGFQITEVNNLRGNYLVVLTILEERRAVTFETIVTCPGVPR